MFRMTRACYPVSLARWEMNIISIQGWRGRLISAGQPTGQPLLAMLSQGTFERLVSKSTSQSAMMPNLPSHKPGFQSWNFGWTILIASSPRIEL